MTQKMIRILSVDDHSFLVEGLRARLEIERDIEFTGSLPNAEHLIATVREKPAGPRSRPRCTEAMPPAAISEYRT